MFLNKTNNTTAGGGNNSLNITTHTSYTSLTSATHKTLTHKVKSTFSKFKTTAITLFTATLLGANTAYAACSADIDMGNKKITNLATPSASTDATNKSYVDNKINTTYSNPFYSNSIDFGTTPLVDNTWVEIIPKDALGQDSAIYMCAIYTDYMTEESPYKFTAAIGIAGTHYWSGTFNTEFDALSFLPHVSNSADFKWRYSRDSVAHTWGVEIKFDDIISYNWNTAGKKLYVKCVKM